MRHLAFVLYTPAMGHTQAFLHAFGRTHFAFRPCLPIPLPCGRRYCASTSTLCHIFSRCRIWTLCPCLQRRCCAVILVGRGKTRISTSSPSPAYIAWCVDYSTTCILCSSFIAHMTFFPAPATSLPFSRDSVPNHLICITSYWFTGLTMPSPCALRALLRFGRNTFLHALQSFRHRLNTSYR